MAFLPTTPPKEIEDKFSIANNTLTQIVKANPRDEIGVEVGDSKQPDFKPQVKVMRWNNEVNFSLRAEENIQATVQVEGEKIKYQTENYEVHLYDKPDAGEDGGFEFEWVLLKKPLINILTATIQTKGLDFFYQPPLTQQEIDEGASRPDNVVGSYAVYHKTKGGMNDATGMEYKVGKAFHIYRPQATDANGDSIWGDLHIDEANGLLTVTLDQKWLDNAVYPVVVDPTFGYTSIGGTSADATGTIRGHSSFGAGAGEDGATIDKITIYTTGTSSAKVKGAIYFSPTTWSLLSPQSGELTNPADGWNDYTISGSPTMSNGVDYKVCQWANGGLRYHDTGSSSTQSYRTLTYGAWPDPLSGSTTNNITSRYATYTASGGGAVPGPGWKSLLGVGQFLFALFLRLLG